MAATAADFTFTYHESQRQRFRSGELGALWRQRYPDLFDSDDLRLLETEHQRQYHFFEWLSAILLFEATGYLSLVEGYTAGTHPAKQRKLANALDSELINWLHRHASGEPDLFVYRPQKDDWFFCEVKGGRDRERPNQRQWSLALQAELKRRGIPGVRRRTIQLREIAT